MVLVVDTVVVLKVGCYKNYEKIKVRPEYYRVILGNQLLNIFYVYRLTEICASTSDRPKALITEN